jgi:bifunctional UDP-N-acetylglucosamine pyrophosphorylase/glucosamine-1-phosphate N-acetyltransferase
MKALILAGGAGRRMWPFAAVRNKAALPVANVPAVRRLADDLLGLGIDGLVVAVGAQAASVRHALRGLPDDRVALVETGSAPGTAAAAWAAISTVDTTCPWLIVHGDIVCPIENLRALRARFDADRPAAAVLVTPLEPGDDPRDWLEAQVADGAIVRIVGHGRDDGLLRLVGAAALAPHALTALRDNPGIVRSVPVGGMPPVDSEIAQSLQVLIDEGASVAAVLAPEFTADLDKPWHILDANERLLRYLAARVERDIVPASCRIDDGAEISGRLVLGENVVIGKRSVIRGTLFAASDVSITNGPILQGTTMLGARTRVRDYCLLEDGVVYGPDGIVGHGAEFSGVAFDNVYLYHYCELWGVLGSSVDIGAATVCGTLRFDDGRASHRVAGRRETPHSNANASFIGDYTRTGVNAVLMPGSKLGCWSCLGAGVVWSGDLPDRQATFVRQELETRPWGPERYGW